MKVTLIFPGITMEGFSKPPVRLKTGWIHHGLGYISAVLKEKGHEVTLVDLRQLFGWEELPAVLRRLKPDIVGITVMSLDFDASVKSAGIVKATDPGIKVIVGGIHPTIMEHELLDNPDIDYVFKGEAEITLPAILEDIKSGSIKTKTITGESPDIEKIPFVDRFLFKMLEPPMVPFLKMPFMTAVTGRGCMYNCSFCQPAERILFGRKVKRVSPEKFIDELDYINRKSGFNSLMFWDDCLVEDIKWVEKFLSLYAKKRFRKPFVCQSRADILARNPGLFRDMKRQGLVMILIGFESGNQRILNFLRKGTKVEDNYRAMKICKKLGIRIFANYMLGIPTETNEEARDTVRMIKKMKPYVPSPTFYTPFPGSDLFDYCVKNGLSLIKKHAEYVRNPISPKIKGIDYDFMRKALAETTKIPKTVKIWRKIDRLKLGRFNKELIAGYVPGPDGTE